jgi:hypothetical protein
MRIISMIWSRRLPEGKNSMSAHAYTKDQFLKQPATRLFPKHEPQP